MKYLIVNGDDFGYSFGVNKGIIKAHREGIIMSTSVLVDSIAAHEARDLINKYPNLSVGLHFTVVDKETRLAWLYGTYRSLIKDQVKKEFERQIKKFIGIVGKKPDHIDGHYHIHTHPRIKPLIADYSKKHHIPVRAFGKVNFIHKFYGQNKITQQTSLKEIGVENLLKILSNLKDGVNELMCHPAIIDKGLLKISSYNKERGYELKTLIDKRVLDFIRSSNIKLISWKEL